VEEGGVADQIYRKSIRGIFWALADSVGTAALSLGTFLAMARLLDPQDFGIVALASSFVILFNIVTGHTFADALVQTPQLDDSHTHTAFWSTLLIGSGLAGVAWQLAAPLGQWVGEPELGSVLFWLALVMPLNACGSVQTALLRRNMNFRAVASYSLAGRIAGAVAGLGAAVMGFGYWSLVIQQILAALVTNLLTVLLTTWRPRLVFSRQRFVELYRFGFHVSASQVVSGAGEQAVNLLIGAGYGTVALGHFNIAWRTVQLVRTLIASAVYHVGFSAFSRLQEDREAFAQSFRSATQMSCLFGFPIGIGLAVCAEPILTFGYGAKWLDAAPLLQLLSLQMLPGFFGMFLSAAYRAAGRPNWVLWLSLADLGIMVTGIELLVGLPIWTMAALWTVKSFLFLPLHLILVSRLLNVRAADLLQPVYVPLISSFAMGLLLIGASRAVHWGLHPGIALGAQIAAGALIYRTIVWIVAPELEKRVLDALRSAFRGGRKTVIG
jgi:PST family polysaccharide transporter